MYTATMFKAKQDLNEFLREHPELQDVQAMIEENLRKAGSQENRMAILATLLREGLLELKEVLEILKN